MIVTVTLNPSVDRTVSIENLKRGSVNRVDLMAVDPGGKGVNVSRALSVYGADTYAVLVCGSFGSRWFGERLTELKINHKILLTQGVTRNNVTLVEGDGTVTKINEPGFELTGASLAEVKAILTDLDLSGAWVVFAGSLNPGADDNTYRDLIEFAHSRGAQVALDASGPEMKAALAAKPDLIKPNQHELSELVDRALVTIDDIVLAAREVISEGISRVVCSLGADGALFIDQTTVLHAEPQEVVVGVPVGAGDILLATFLAGGANAQALPDAVAWSAASVPLEGTAIPTKEQVAAVKVKINANLEPTRSLVEVN
jgi:1-phosphofructokinase